MQWRRVLLVVLIASGLGGCGGGNPAAPPPSPVTLTSLAVSPASIAIQLPATQQFTATGKYSDGSSKDLTLLANWASSDQSVAIVSNDSEQQGMTTFVGSGTAHITAAVGSVQDSATVTINSPITVAISPLFASVVVTHQNRGFTATVQGTTNAAVAWSVDGVPGGNATVGTISDGVYFPPDTGGYHTITATSQVDLSKAASAQVAVMDVPGVYTRQYDNTRSGLNADEIVLTPQNVNTQQFGKIGSYPVDGIIYAQPLYVANVNMPGAGYRNVVYAATTYDEVYAFDADYRDPGPLWQKKLLNTSAGETPVPCGELPDFCGFGSEVGITGTPVIDATSGTLYVDTFSEIGGTYYHKLHALDITTGGEKFGGPVVLQASVSGTGDSSDGTNVHFVAGQHLQRPGLLLANGQVYVGFASYSDVAPFHGWLLAYDAATLQQTAVFNATPDGSGAGIWQGAGGVAADASGNIYVTTGNGDFSADAGGRNYGDSILKLSPNLQVQDYFTPYDQVTLNNTDYDLGSGAPLLLPDQSGTHPHLLVADGKPGEIYLVDRDNMGHFHAGDDSQIVQSLPNATSRVMTSPAYWNGHVYFTDQNNVLRMYTLQNGQFGTNPLSVTNPDGQSGLSISAKNSQAGILWMISVVGGVGAALGAYDSNDLSLLYISTQNPTRDFVGGAATFQAPLVVNGKVYVGAQNQLDVFGLLP